MRETKKESKKKDVYLVSEVARILKFKRASGSFYVMLKQLNLPARFMLREGNSGVRKIRVFNESDLAEMLRYRNNHFSLKYYV